MTYDPTNTNDPQMTMTLEDIKNIDDYYNGLDDTIEYEKHIFLDEIERLDMQPNTCFGLVVCNQEWRFDEATIKEVYPEDFYCIAQFDNDRSEIYVPAKNGSCNSVLKPNDKVTIKAFSTPGLVKPWRSKYVKFPQKSHEYTINIHGENFNSRYILGSIIGPAGYYINQIKDNSMKYPFHRPKITLTSIKEGLSVNIFGVLEFIDIDSIKKGICNILDMKNISYEAH